MVDIVDITPEVIRPQAGPQSRFVRCSADIVFYGGQAGGGKSYALLLDSFRGVKHPEYGAVIFRRTTKQVTAEGGLWDTATDLYSKLGGKPNNADLYFSFPTGGRVGFAHMEHEKNRLDWQGSQIPYIGFDELTHFTWKQFSYMLSRNRSTIGLRTKIRATLNPDPDHFARNWVDWYIGPDGYAIPERSGVIRWMVMSDDAPVWFGSKAEAFAEFPNSTPLSFTFIVSSLEDNQILLKQDPKYLANLEALPKVERERLRRGNWNIRASAGSYFQRSSFEIVDALPAGKHRKVVRAWDFAGTEQEDATDPDWTAGVKLSVIEGVYYVEHVERFRVDASMVKGRVRNTASGDGTGTSVRLTQDPGQAGKFQVKDYVAGLAGYQIKYSTASGDKSTRATPFASQVQAGNVKLVRGPWNEAYLAELENFPVGSHDDQVDASADAFNELALGENTTGILDYYRREAEKKQAEQQKDTAA